ncbi:hypothetical protein [Flexivirga oryzae]|uniref:Uncharacterized protein n=1 Tax=Flexivirga oryzae TaxID=1794944 RepID=A0A839N8E7_9MICO|nr:hypothetical protein [Flexivirga oryzae]MBB2893507.1 hypothetical protein [Flexivirga oryzae]
MSTRTDLPYLRGRSLRSASANPVPETPASPVSSSLNLSAPAAPPVSSSLDLGGAAGFDTSSAAPSPHEVSPPLRSSEYFAGTPTERPRTTQPASGGTSLNLFDEEPAAPTTPPSGTSLDLDAPSSASLPQALDPRSRHTRPLRHDLGLPSINAGERRLFTEHDPVVELTRMQSAAGAIEAKVAVSNPTEVVLGIVFETADDRESLVLPGLSQQGPDPRRPIFRATSGGVAVNLRRITDIHRLLLFAVPTRPSKQMPGGTVTVTTYGGSRLEVPLVAGPTLGAQALVTAYVVEGRLVLRAEHDPYSGTLQQVCAAYGYREISWRDPYTPLV